MMQKYIYISLTMVALVLAPALRAETADLDKVRSLMKMQQYSLALDALTPLVDGEVDGAAELREQVVVLAAEQAEQEKIQQLLLEAETYAWAHQTSRARARLDRLLRIVPGHEGATELRARLEVESEMEFLSMEETEEEGLQEGAFVPVDEVDESPQVVRHRAPLYPREAKRQGVEGKARFLATIGPDGRVEGVRLMGPIPGWETMNESAREAVSHWRFTPATKNGVKVRTIVNVAVDFRLEDPPAFLRFSNAG